MSATSGYGRIELLRLSPDTGEVLTRLNVFQGQVLHGKVFRVEPLAQPTEGGLLKDLAQTDGTKYLVKIALGSQLIEAIIDKFIPEGSKLTLEVLKLDDESLVLKLLETDVVSSPTQVSRDGSQPQPIPTPDLAEWSAQAREVYTAKPSQPFQPTTANIEQKLVEAPIWAELPRNAVQMVRAAILNDFIEPATFAARIPEATSSILNALNDLQAAVVQIKPEAQESAVQLIESINGVINILKPIVTSLAASASTPAFEESAGKIANLLIQLSPSLLPTSEDLPPQMPASSPTQTELPSQEVPRPDLSPQTASAQAKPPVSEPIITPATISKAGQEPLPPLIDKNPLPTPALNQNQTAVIPAETVKARTPQPLVLAGKQIATSPPEPKQTNSQPPPQSVNAKPAPIPSHSPQTPDPSSTMVLIKSSVIPPAIPAVDIEGESPSPISLKVPTTQEQARQIEQVIAQVQKEPESSEMQPSRYLLLGLRTLAALAAKLASNESSTMEQSVEIGKHAAKLSSISDSWEGAIIAPMLTRSPEVPDAVPRLLMTLLFPGGNAELAVLQLDPYTGKSSGQQETSSQSRNNQYTGIIQLDTEGLGHIRIRLDYREVQSTKPVDDLRSASDELQANGRVGGQFNTQGDAADIIRAGLKSLERALSARGISSSGFLVVDLPRVETGPIKISPESRREGEIDFKA